MRQSVNAIIAGLGSLYLSGCMVTPIPLTDEAVSDFAAKNLAEVTAGQEPVDGAISLSEATARAIKYNLDHHIEKMAQAVALRRLKVTRHEMLPDLVVNSGYRKRDNTDASRSRNLVAGTLGTYSTSDRRDSVTADLEFSWHILDFGLSYVRAKQDANRVLIARERRRKAVNRVIEDVRVAYWRALGSQRIVGKLQSLEGAVKRALRNSRASAAEGLIDPLTALTYQRELVNIRRELQALQRDLTLAKSQLAALMNLSPDARFSLVDPKRPRIPRVDISASEMIDIAVHNRPELIELAYELKINKDERSAALLEILPGINLHAGANYDNNDFILHDKWVTWGARASWNLLKVFSYPARSDFVDANKALLETRALAVTMAIMTQVHVSRARYAHARRELSTAGEALSIQRRILSKVRGQTIADRIGEQVLIRERMNLVLAQVRHDIARASLENAFANLYASMGFDMIDVDISQEMSIKEIASHLRQIWVNGPTQIAKR